MDSRVFHEIIDTAGERYVDGPSARTVLLTLFNRSRRSALNGCSNSPLERQQEIR